MDKHKRRTMDSWSEAEFDCALDYALAQGREDRVSVLYLCRCAGLQPRAILKINDNQRSETKQSNRWEIHWQQPVGWPTQEHQACGFVVFSK